MKKKYALTSFLIMLLLFIIGLILMFSSVSAGLNAGQRFIQTNGGDPEVYYSVINNVAANCRSAGVLISSIGGAGILLSGYVIYREVIETNKNLPI